EEKLQINKWLDSEPENQNQFNDLKNLWESASKKYEASDISSLWTEVAERTGINKESEEQIIYKLKNEKCKPNFLSLVFSKLQTPIVRYAAIFAIVICIPILYIIFTTQLQEEIQWEVVNVENSKQSNITLADGTEIFLDSGSRLHIPENFGTESRTVKLEGEAYFNVINDAVKPFRIYSENAVITVLGTMFNVRAWKETERVDVTVSGGKVSLGIKESDEQIVLNEGFIGSLSSAGILSDPKSVDVSKFLSWMKGERTFSNTPLFEVLNQVERWYNIQFSLSDSTIIHEKLEVTINKNSLNDVLDVISTLTNTTYSTKGRHVTLRTIPEVR
ncbi:MAG: FecR domain-containing protein, partial [Ignavibacteria bacterium]